MRWRTRGLKALTPLLLASGVLAGWPGPAAAQFQKSLHGGIEIGAKGVKAIVIEVILDRKGHAVAVGRPRLDAKARPKTANTTLASLDKDKRFRKDAIQETAEEVGKFFQRMQKEFKIPPRNIYVIGSSGLPNAPNKAELRAAIERATRDKEGKGKDLIFIDQKDEVRLSIMGLLPPEYLGKALFVDVGSGSTKCGYFEQETSTSVARMVIVRTKLKGTVTFTALVKASRGGTAGTFAERAAALRDDRFTRPLEEEEEGRPGLVNRERVFLSGGIVWALVTLTKPEACNEPLVSLTADDIDKFCQKLAKAPGVFPAPDLGLLDPALAEQAREDVQRVRDTFTPENLAAGGEILRGIAKAFRLRQQQKSIYFARDGYIAWIHAYVKESARRRP